jgi:putative molybdopterin biosynthesis protein
MKGEAVEPVARIGREEQLAEIADGHRRAILQRLMVSPATLSQLGREFDRHPAWIRHHLKRLEAVGLVELSEVRTVRNYTEKYYRATAGAYAVHLLIVPETSGRESVVVLGSHDFALEMLAADATSRRGAPVVVPAAIGSLDGLVALRQGLADVAGCHLFDVDADEYNLPFVRHLFPDRRVVAFTLAHRDQGLIVPAGNPLGIGTVEDLARPGLTIANRNEGSGTRVWLDGALRRAGIEPDALAGYGEALTTHSAVAERVAAGRADVGLGIRAAAERFELGFVPLFQERYDLVFDADRVNDAALAPLLDRLLAGSFKTEVHRLSGYDAGHTGDELRPNP